MSMRSSILPLYCSSAVRIFAPYYYRIRFKNMTTGKLNEPPPESLNKFQQILHSDSTYGWDKCWEEGITPWDLGSPTPVLVHLNNMGSLPKGRALVPGCGSGHDVVAIACAERYVVGLDISDNAIKKAAELFSSSPKAEHFTFLKADFFTWSSAQLFDLIFDYTFFCAIEPKLRSQWARKISDLLKPDGELLTLMFPVDDHEGGPPYKVSAADYEEVLHPAGFKATQIVDNELAVAPRWETVPPVKWNRRSHSIIVKGREKLGRWKRTVFQSSL